MDRAVRRIESTPPKARQDELQPFSAYDDAANIILLGDPGAGKSHTFRQAAVRSGGRCITARAFLVKPAVKFEGTLFIDGLDERRAGRSDRDTVDALVEKLFAVEPRKVRISCRIADCSMKQKDGGVLQVGQQNGRPWGGRSADGLRRW